MPPTTSRLRVRQRLGKYRIESRLAESPFAHVYGAYDTIEGLRVALKVAHLTPGDRDSLDLFRREVRLTARLDHPNILPIKDASFIDGRFVIVSKLADCALSERIRWRLSAERAYDFTYQLVSALAHAHGRGILHCDIKPENILVFPGHQLRLADFGIARVARHTINASGSGTLGSMAPEQAMGKPSLRSDVFSMGLIIYRLFTGHTPEWPFAWPFPAHDRLIEKAPAEFIRLLRRSLHVAPRLRFADAVELDAGLAEVRPAVEAHLARLRRQRARRVANGRRTRRTTKGRRR